MIQYQESVTGVEITAPRVIYRLGVKIVCLRMKILGGFLPLIQQMDLLILILNIVKNAHFQSVVQHVLKVILTNVQYADQSILVPLLAVSTYFLMLLGLYSAAPCLSPTTNCY